MWLVLNSAIKCNLSHRQCDCWVWELVQHTMKDASALLFFANTQADLKQGSFQDVFKNTIAGPLSQHSAQPLDHLCACVQPGHLLLAKVLVQSPCTTVHHESSNRTTELPRLLSFCSLSGLSKQLHALMAHHRVAWMHTRATTSMALAACHFSAVVLPTSGGVAHGLS